MNDRDAPDPAALAAPGSAERPFPGIDSPADVMRLRAEASRFLLSYKFGVDEVMTKIRILREEFTHTHAYNPIEHVNSRVKSPESIVRKAQRKGIPLTIEAIRETIRDIGGVRVTCSFVSDVFNLRDMLVAQGDITVLEVRDYITTPKPNGYKSLHLLVEIPVFMSDRVEQVPVEVQIRTIAMDFWASLEHKIYYKYEHVVPAELTDELFRAAQVANELDLSMEQLHEKVKHLGDAAP